MSKIEELAWKHGVFSEPVTLMQYYNNIVALMVLNNYCHQVTNGGTVSLQYVCVV